MKDLLSINEKLLKLNVIDLLFNKNIFQWEIKDFVLENW